jgi:hypothetical protein
MILGRTDLLGMLHFRGLGMLGMSIGQVMRCMIPGTRGDMYETDGYLLVRGLHCVEVSRLKLCSQPHISPAFSK